VLCNSALFFFIISTDRKYVLLSKPLNFGKRKSCTGQSLVNAGHVKGLTFVSQLQTGKEKLHNTFTVYHQYQVSPKAATSLKDGTYGQASTNQNVITPPTLKHAQI
jgi:hypothetical protein